MANLKLNVLHGRPYQADGQEKMSWTIVGVAWQNEKGIDAKIWSTPVHVEADGCIRLVLREPMVEGQPPRPAQPSGPQTPGLQLVMLHPRSFQGRDGSQGTSWNEVGIAWMNDRGVDAKLHYIPVGPHQDGAFRILFREPNEQDRQRRAPQQQAVRPQHRDQLSRMQAGQPRVDPGPQPPTYAEPGDDLPF
jgi:hypothetical protein